MRKRSYNSFSYADIADIVGIKKASIHYHFPTKDILGVQIIRRYRKKIDRLITSLNEHTDEPVQKLQSYFEFFRRGLNRDLICPGLILSVEYNTLKKEMQEEITDLFDFYYAWLTDILKDGLSKNIFHFEETASEMALYIISAVEGAIVFSRAYQLKDHYNNVVQKLERLIIS